MNKMDTALPVLGGSTGGIITSFILPSAEQMVTTIILAAIGAIVGYFIKLILDIYFKNRTK